MMPTAHDATIRRGRAERRLPGRNRTKADIVVYRLGDDAVAVKDYSARPFLVRHTVGRWSTGRECRAYARLVGCPGVARFRGRLGPWSLALDWIDAVPLRDLGRPPTPSALRRLEASLAAIHARGVALGDLHHRDVLIDRNDGVTVVDFATAVVAGARGGGWFERLREQDLVALARLRMRYWGVPREEAFADCPPRALRRRERWRRLRGRT